MTVAIPAPLVATGQAMPDVCVLHGRPADRHKRVIFRSKTPAWTYVLILGGVILFAIVAAVLQKRIKSPAWPFCPACAAVRRRRLLIGVGLVVLGVVAVVVVAGVMPQGASYGPLLVLAFVLLLLVGLVFIARASWASVASGFASRNGMAVEVPHPDPAFVQAAAPALQWAAQQQAAQQQASTQWAAQQQATRQRGGQQFPR